jgi:hypothetical protein
LVFSSTQSCLLDTIYTIQRNCGFYNYEIAHSPLPELPDSQLKNTIVVHYVGNLNTGTVNIQGDQIGIKKQLNQEKP